MEYEITILLRVEADTPRAAIEDAEAAIIHALETANDTGSLLGGRAVRATVDGSPVQL